MTDPKGSIWRKWDLHVHTPVSIENNYGGSDDEVWERYISDLEKLPQEFKVLGINDYIFLDGYERLLKAKESGRLNNIDLLLPVIELRIDKFGGTESDLSRVNYHIIFSNELTTQIIKDQFLNTLPAVYQLDAKYNSFKESWNAVATKESLIDLGKMIIESVPLEKRAQFKSPLFEGFNGINFDVREIQKRLRTHYFRGKILTAVGKTEWANIKWNEQSIAEKKTIINSVHFVFISSRTPDDFNKSKDSLGKAGVNNRLLDCSDAHNFSNSAEKERIGKCFTWIKADSCFEGLKQAFYEPEIRIHINEKPPLDPIFKIEKAEFNFPAESKIKDEEFCLRGTAEIQFSPNLTCLIGGRGTGKSMVLNLLHEKLAPTENTFFKEHPLSFAKIDAGVKIYGATNVEFLSQNEIEAFAINQGKFTSAIYSRLVKLDKEGILEKTTMILGLHIEDINKQILRYEKRIQITKQIDDKKKEIDTYKNIVDFLQDEEYASLSGQIKTKNDRLEQIKESSRRLTSLITNIQTILKEYSSDVGGAENQYRSFHTEIINTFNDIVKRYMASDTFTEVGKEETDLSIEIKELQESLDAYLSTKNLSTENMVDISRAIQMLSSAESILTSYELELASINRVLSVFVPARKIRDNYEQEFSVQLAPIIDRLKTINVQVKSIGLEYGFDNSRAKNTLLKSFMKRLPLDEKGAQYREDYVSSVLSQTDPEHLSTAAEFIANIPDDKQSAKTMLLIKNHFDNPDNFEIYKLLALREYVNADEYKMIKVSYDGKPLINSSFGQRCTAAIVILLLLGNTPLIIDEPEAHLDSSLIAKYLVDLIKKQKQNRQIIFATHNANFVVNGDAELINVLKMDADKKTLICPTTLENLKYRDDIVALEGGKEAFQHRDDKYEFK